MTSDAINPSHYKTHPVFGDLECVDVTSRLGFLRGNAIKYLWRLGRKDSASQDAHKALWYIDRLASSYTAPSESTGLVTFTPPQSKTSSYLAVSHLLTKWI